MSLRTTTRILCCMILLVGGGCTRYLETETPSGTVPPVPPASEETVGCSPHPVEYHAGRGIPRAALRSAVPSHLLAGGSAMQSFTAFFVPGC